MRRDLHNRRRAGFIVIWGWRMVTTSDSTPPRSCKCPNCNVEEAVFVGKLRRRWFTLFFIPLFPAGSADQAQRISQCAQCKQIFDLPVEQLVRRSRGSMANRLSDTFPLYNELCQNPEDGRRLLRLLEMYEALGEYAEAENTARHFPKALEAEPRCLLALSRMYQATEFKEVAPS